jgi:hypothetical protein
MCSASHTADVETIIQLVPNFCAVSLVMEAMAVVIRCLVPGVNGYSAGLFRVKLCAKMHVAQLLQTLSLLTAEHTSSSIVD